VGRGYALFPILNGLYAQKIGLHEAQVDRRCSGTL
jgi:hypothetical protein